MVIVEIYNPAGWKSLFVQEDFSFLSTDRYSTSLYMISMKDHIIA